MKYKIEYQIKDDSKIHRRYYNALDPSTAYEMFRATQEESLSVFNVVQKSIKIFRKSENGKWEE